MQTPGVAAVSSKASQVKDQIASAILSGVGTARERMARRRQQMDVQQSASLRWGKTYWQAAAEHSEK